MNQQFLTEDYLKVRSRVFPFTIGKSNLTYSKQVKVFSVPTCGVFSCF